MRGLSWSTPTAAIRLLELMRNMHRLFEKPQADEKRRLLNFVRVELDLEGGAEKSCRYGGNRLT